MKQYFEEKEIQKFRTAIGSRVKAAVAERGLRTICPTSTAIDALSDAVRSCEIPQRPLEEASV